MRAKQHNYTDEQRAYIRDHCKGRMRKELLELFNTRFNTSLKITQLEGFLKRNGLTTGLDGLFKKGQKAWNKGMKGLDLAGENGKKTQFKKGQTPLNYRPIGSERVNVEGYVEIKTKDPRTWELKNRVIWEQANGPIPKGHAVIFGDGNRHNFDLDNLILVSRKQLISLNRHKLIQNDADLTRTGILVADLYSKIYERKR